MAIIRTLFFILLIFVVLFGISRIKPVERINLRSPNPLVCKSDCQRINNCKLVEYDFNYLAEHKFRLIGDITQRIIVNSTDCICKQKCYD